MKDKEELKWRVDEAIESFTRYKKLVEDEKIKEKVKEELKKRAEEYKNLSENL